jgi:magnesium chelatase family protein
MDRIDLHIEVPRLKFEKLSSEALAEKSSDIRERILAARNIQAKRLANEPIFSNSEMDTRQIREYCKIGESEKELLKRAIRQMSLSPRAYHRLLKVARTIADLANQNDISTSQIAEAIQYRFRDEN